MTNEEVAASLEKLAYHVSLLAMTINSEIHPIEALVVARNWSRADLNKVHDIFERWDKRIEQGGKMNGDDFEADFYRELDITYQGLKGIVLAFYKNQQWTNVCEAYVDFFGDSPSAELGSIKRRKRT